MLMLVVTHCVTKGTGEPFQSKQRRARSDDGRQATKGKKPTWQDIHQSVLPSVALQVGRAEVDCACQAAAEFLQKTRQSALTFESGSNPNRGTHTPDDMMNNLGKISQPYYHNTCMHQLPNQDHRNEKKESRDS